MSKILKIILFAIFLPSLAFAQNQGDVLGLGQGGSRIFCRVNTNGTAIADDTDANYISCDTAGRIIMTSDSTSFNFSMLEDAPYGDGQRGVPIFGIRADSSSNYTSLNGDAIPFALSGQGNLRVNVTKIGQIANADDLLKVEDVAASADGAGVMPLYAAQDPLTLDQSATNDNAQPKTDRMGRTLVTYSPAGETFQSCGTATAVTSDVAIKAAVASNRMYVTSINCKNTSTTVGPTIDFKDGSTIIAVGGLSATAAAGTLTGELDLTFPVPLRGTSNTAFNFATNTATSSVTCCAQGYVSVN